MEHSVDHNFATQYTLCVIENGYPQYQYFLNFFRKKLVHRHLESESPINRQVRKECDYQQKTILSAFIYLSGNNLIYKYLVNFYKQAFSDWDPTLMEKFLPIVFGKNWLAISYGILGLWGLKTKCSNHNCFGYLFCFFEGLENWIFSAKTIQSFELKNNFYNEVF